MSIDHRGLDVGMAQEFLNRANIIAALQQNSSAERAWFCVEALTFSLTARCVRKALISGSATSRWMADVMKVDEPFDPLAISLLAAAAAMARTQRPAKLVQQLRTPGDRAHGPSRNR